LAGNAVNFFKLQQTARNKEPAPVGGWRYLIRDLGAIGGAAIV